LPFYVPLLQAAAEDFVKQNEWKNKSVSWSCHKTARRVVRAFRWLVVVVFAFSFGFMLFILNVNFQNYMNCDRKVFNPFCQASRKLSVTIDDNMNTIAAIFITHFILGVSAAFFEFITLIGDI
jgi:hypothetical protein